MPNRYVSKPQAFEAVQWTGENADEVVAFGAMTGDTIPPRKVTVDELTAGPVCRLLSGANGATGWLEIPVGYWIVNKAGDKRDLWPVDPDHFAATYQAGDLNGWIAALERLDPETPIAAGAIARDLRRLIG